jgi:hypothetical protein
VRRDGLLCFWIDLFLLEHLKLVSAFGPLI